MKLTIIVLLTVLAGIACKSRTDSTLQDTGTPAEAGAGADGESAATPGTESPAIAINPKCPQLRPRPSGPANNCQTPNPIEKPVAFDKAALLGLGTMVSSADLPNDKRTTEFIITAPHGKFDGSSKQIVAETAEALKWSYVIAEGYRTTAHPYNVNRPTEGFGNPSACEPASSQSTYIYETYQALINKTSPPDARKFFVEVHGNSRPPSVANIEVATVNMTMQEAEQIKTILTKHLTTNGRKLDQLNLPDAKGPLTDMKILMEGPDKDTITFLAGGAKNSGTLCQVRRTKAKALHFEFAKVYRSRYLKETISYLSDVLEEVAELPFIKNI